MRGHGGSNHIETEEVGDYTPDLSDDLLDYHYASMHKFFLPGWWIVPSVIFGAYIWWHICYAIVGFLIK